jgi:hypothetical protein
VVRGPCFAVDREPAHARASGMGVRRPAKTRERGDRVSLYVQHDTFLICSCSFAPPRNWLVEDPGGRESASSNGRVATCLLRPTGVRFGVNDRRRSEWPSC